MAHASKCDDLADMLLRNIVTLGGYIGPRLSEYAQKNQKKVDVHTYPSGTTVIKAFTANDFIFYDAKKHIIEDLCPESIESIAAIKITWRIQKNRQNGQSITLATDKKFPDRCLVRSASGWSSVPGTYNSRMICPSPCTKLKKANIYTSWEAK